MVEIGPAVEYAEVAGGELDSGMSQRPTVQDDSIMVTSLHTPPDFSTYEDENGDPCSAV